MTPESFEKIADALNDALILLSPEGIVEAINKPAMLAAGCARKTELLQRHLADFVEAPEETLQPLLRAVRRTPDETIGSLLFLNQNQSQRVIGRRIDWDGDDYQLLLRIEPTAVAVKQFSILNEKIDQLNREIARRESAESQLRFERDVAEFGREIGIALVQPQHLASSLRQCTNLMVERLGAAFARIWLADPGQQELHLVASSGMYTHLDGAHSRIRFGEFKIGRIAKSQKPHVSNAVIGDDEIHDQQWAKREGMIAFAGYPLIVDGVTVGVMAIFSRQVLSEAVAEAMASVANGIALRILKQSIEDGLAKQTAALRESDRRKDEFLAMLSHELRNPLAPIRSGLDLLSLEHSDHLDTIVLMQQQVEHLVRLVDDLLDVSRIMRGKVTLRRSPVELAVLVKRAVETLRLSIENADHDLQVILPESPVWIHADAVRIKQVIENLLKNACKYTDRGGKISIAVSLEQNEALIVVKDDGIGIDKDLLNHVFDLFTQSPQTLDRAQGGLGIGLTLVKNLVEMHEGSVSAASEGIGRGSAFEVRLPVCEAPQQVVADDPMQNDCPPIRILAVDDNRGARTVLARLFEKLGPHQILTAEDGPSALQQLAAFSPHLVVLDIGLPGMNGFEVARAIRQECNHDSVLLVALTGYGQKDDLRKSQEAGFDLHLVKPPGIDQLQEVLRHPKLSQHG